MTKRELEQVYKLACDGKGFKPNDGQFKIWQLTLGNLEELDLQQALVWYWADNTNFPMPAELKTLAERSRRARASQTLGWIVRYQCPVCGMTMTSNPHTENRPPRTCNSCYGPIGSGIMLEEGEVCGAILDVLEDRREEMVKPDGKRVA